MSLIFLEPEPGEELCTCSSCERLKAEPMTLRLIRSRQHLLMDRQREERETAAAAALAKARADGCVVKDDFVDLPRTTADETEVLLAIHEQWQENRKNPKVDQTGHTWHTPDALAQDMVGLQGQLALYLELGRLAGLEHDALLAFAKDHWGDQHTRYWPGWAPRRATSNTAAFAGYKELDMFPWPIEVKTRSWETAETFLRARDWESRPNFTQAWVSMYANTRSGVNKIRGWLDGEEVRQRMQLPQTRKAKRGHWTYEVSKLEWDQYHPWSDFPFDTYPRLERKP